MPEVKHYFWEI